MQKKKEKINILYAVVVAVVIIITSLFFISPSNKNVSIKNINGSDLESVLAMTKDLQIIDVRTPSEYKGGHVKDSINIDWNNIELFKSKMSGLPKDKTYVVYCHSGNRSSKAVAYMKNTGFTSIYMINGGILGGELNLVDY